MDSEGAETCARLRDDMRGLGIVYNCCFTLYGLLHVYRLLLVRAQRRAAERLDHGVCLFASLMALTPVLFDQAFNALL